MSLHYLNRNMWERNFWATIRKVIFNFIIAIIREQSKKKERFKPHFQLRKYICKDVKKHLINSEMEHFTANC